MSDDAAPSESLNVDAQVVRALLAEQCPALAMHEITPVASDGTVNRIFRVGDAAVRLPFLSDVSAEVDTEARWLPWLAARLAVPVPTLVHHGWATDAYPSSWMVCEWVDGASIEPGAREDQIALDLAAALRQLQSLPIDGAPASHRAGELAAKDRIVQWGFEHGADLIPEGIAELWHSAKHATTTAYTWVHSDLLPGNIVLGDDRELAAIIDWAQAGVADPACDLLPAWSVLSASGRASLFDVLEADDDTILRGKGWAIVEAVPAIAYNRDRNPGMVRVASAILTALVER